MTTCGYVALMGEPNAGKSTLLNQFLKTKLSIVTPKVQTTRRRILGIHTHGKTQIIFVDTPGIFTPTKPLEKAMVKEAWNSVKDSDVLVVLVDVSKKSHQYSRDLLLKALDQNKKTILVLNKVDSIPKDYLLAITTHMLDTRLNKVFMISALKNKGVQDVLDYLETLMPPGPWCYDEDQLSDTPTKILTAEMTREKVFLNVHQEIPYHITVQTENWETFENGSIKISQVIHVNKKNHKQIILGQGGATLKRIGVDARKEIEKFLNCPVHLKLFVRLTKDWMDRLVDYDVFDER